MPDRESGGAGTPPQCGNTTSDKEAEVIVSSALESVGNAISDKDFGAFATHLHLPYEVSTSERREVIKDVQGLEQMYRRSVDYLDHDGVSEMSRRVVSASFIDDDTIWTLVETRLVHFGSQIKREPYFVHCELKRVDGRWLFASGHYAISDDPLHMAALVART